MTVPAIKSHLIESLRNLQLPMFFHALCRAGRAGDKRWVVLRAISFEFV